jgi:WD40 repeat protein
LLYDAVSGANTATLKGYSSYITCIAFSQGGVLLASGSLDGTIRIWDAVTGTNTATLESHRNRILSVAFSPDGLRLASGAGDGIVQMWEVVSGENIAKLEGHNAAVSPVTFSPDGLRLASASDDRTIRLWDVKSGATTAILDVHTLMITSVAFSNDDNVLIYDTLHEGTFIWNLPPASLPFPTTHNTKSSVPRISDVGWTPLIGVRGRWIKALQDSQFRRVCYIPPLYNRYSAVAMSGQRIAIGCDRSEVIILSTENIDLCFEYL